MNKSTLVLFMAFFSFCHSALATGGMCSTALSDVGYESAEGYDLEAQTQALLSPEENRKLAIEVMRQMAEHKKNSKDTAGDWIQSLTDRQSEQPLDVLEHSALLFILKSGVYSDDEDAETKAKLVDCINTSYRHLTGALVSPDPTSATLPAEVLRNASIQARLFYNAVMEESSYQAPKTSRVQESGLIGRVKGAVNHAKNKAVAVGSSVTALPLHLNKINALIAMGTLTALAFEPGREGFAGALVGLTEASMNEFMIHIGVGHAPKGMRKLFRRMGRVGEFLEEIVLAHTLHHTIVSDYFGAAILPEEKIERAEKYLRKMVEALILDRTQYKNPTLSEEEIRKSPEFQAAVEKMIASNRRGNYGVNGTLKGALGMIATATPFYLLNWGLYHATGSEVFLVSADVSMTTMILQSLYSHWYLHLRPEDKEKAQTNAFQMWYLDTPIGRLSQILHFVHHEQPYIYERTSNGVIMALSMADRLGKGTRPANVRDLTRMNEQGFLPDNDEAAAYRPLLEGD